MAQLDLGDQAVDVGAQRGSGCAVDLFAFLGGDVVGQVVELAETALNVPYVAQYVLRISGLAEDRLPDSVRQAARPT